MKTLLIGAIAAASIAASAQAGPAPAVLSFKLPAQIVGKGDPVKGPQTYPCFASRPGRAYLAGFRQTY